MEGGVRQAEVMLAESRDYARMVRWAAQQIMPITQKIKPLPALILPPLLPLPLPLPPPVVMTTETKAPSATLAARMQPGRSTASSQATTPRPTNITSEGPSAEAGVEAKSRQMWNQHNAVRRVIAKALQNMGEEWLYTTAMRESILQHRQRGNRTVTDRVLEEVTAVFESAQRRSDRGQYFIEAFEFSRAKATRIRNFEVNAGMQRDLLGVETVSG